MRIIYKATKIMSKPFNIKFYTEAGEEVVFKDGKNMPKLIKKEIYRMSKKNRAKMISMVLTIITLVSMVLLCWLITKLK